MMHQETGKDFRSYFADSVESALALAKGELGDDAVLLGSRRTRPEEAAAGQYEVRCAAPAATASPAGPAQEPFGTRVAREIAELRRQLTSMHQAISKSFLSQPPRWLSSSSELAELLSGLASADVDGDIAQEVVEAVHAAGAGEGGNAVMAARGELMRKISIDPSLGAAPSGQRIVALVGPPGAGKTTTAVKLAIHYGLAARRSVHLISTDDYRVGGAEQLRLYASILGCGFQVAATAVALAQALQEHRSKDLILIDTPGLTARDVDEGADLARFLAKRPEIDTQLVLMSCLRSADLSRVWEAFQIFRPGRMIFTRLDETGSLGGPFSLAARTGTPVSFLAAGQRIPEDLEPASSQRLIDGILAPRPAQVTVAAA
jgi:flagellar biosynthesis protein FlhF